MKTQTELHADYTVEDLARILAHHPATVRRLVREGHIPGVYRVNGQWRIKHSTFEAWRAAGGSR